MWVILANFLKKKSEWSMPVYFVKPGHDLQDLHSSGVIAVRVYWFIVTGVGALYIRRRPRVRVEPIQSGGGQER